ncbi:MAG: DUF2516 family protein [Candidatus Nanopelagicales bacterium]
MPPLIDLIVNVLAIVLSLTAVFGFIDCLRQPKQGFEFINRLSKPVWLIILGASAVAIYLQPIGLLGLAGIVGVALYFADVRPKLRELTRR